MERKRLIVFFLLSVFIFTALLVLAQEAIQIQPSSEGKFEASLFEAKIRKGVLTIKINLNNITTNKEGFRIYYKDVYYTDVTAAKKYFALKDTEEQYIAGPKYDNSDGGRFWYEIPAGERKIIWIKFPAPPETTGTVDIFFPGILPFEEVALQ